MKNRMSMLGLMLFAVTLAFTSCKKDYTCECITTTNNSSSSDTYTITDIRSDAKAECDAGDKTDTYLGFQRVKECELK